MLRYCPKAAIPRQPDQPLLSKGTAPMNTSELRLEEFSASVLAVPPLARRADLSIDTAQNLLLIRHMEQGGQRILLYGGNANLYHCSLPDYAQLLGLLAEHCAATTRVIPAVGPDFGKMMDQARLLRATQYRSAMVLPMQGFTSPEGVAEGIARVADAAGFALTLYLKDERYLDLERLGRLVDDGRIVAVKYAVVRSNPADDPFLEALVQRIGAARIVSGMGERPLLAHLGRFGLTSFTTGSGCIAPRASMRLLQALQQRDLAAAEALRERFMPLEDLRESISHTRVLHDAVTQSGLADMGAHLPLLSPSPAEHLPEIARLARDLLAFERSSSFAPALL
jgi:4-hydroxy-tetrahydrodipicolinate synthase